MSVRAKFKVTSLTRVESCKVRRAADGKVCENDQKRPIYDPCELVSIKMNPVSGNNDPDHENTKFWEASPSGELTLGCVNEAASKQFVLGREYYLDFTPA